MKYRTIVLATTVLILSTSTNAALIDNGTYTTDDVSGLDWLDLSQTANDTYSSAETINSGWRYAKNVEIENLFGLMFAGYYYTSTAGGHSDSRYGAYSNQADDVTAFQSLFGFSNVVNGSLYSYGQYEDENNILRFMGTYLGQYSTVVGLNSTADREAYRDSTSNTGMGVYMVRTSAVPVPAAMWLFGSGLVGLIGVARRKTRA